MSNLFINNVAVDFEQSVEKKWILPGCADAVDPCAGVNCGRGNCQTNKTLTEGFHCQCEQGYSGKFCQQRVISCNKEKVQRYYVDGECRSQSMIRTAECVGYCGTGENCCSAVKTKRRRLKMTCYSGDTVQYHGQKKNGFCRKTIMVAIVRKCECSGSCSHSLYSSTVSVDP
ncbi:EGF-like domain protein [Dictyocaulus viviparus]|uniref:EGF-like domain protein n=1 Tax=Dictyocaulus viviparus TaxID=29172 RepID=A0A0D8XA92_DICVI|nr:EGF-like domain protein [Dictyocaulus viviparus]